MGVLRLDRNYFYSLSWGEYSAICEGYRQYRIREMHDFRAMMGAVLRTQPTSLYYLPGDHDGLVEMMEKGEIEKKILSLGNEDVIKLFKLDGKRN